ncbi:MAG TPA: tRNA(His) guanylyltransferase Thg1 family protein [Candidatus Bathyarchaeia archaeon]|nr:tRNA(His) guanylyltransferase Thg1 family protein [Candidatus Bathyarchaeia archaeon]
MKEREIYAGLRTVAPFFVRVDGRNFRDVLARLKREQPYDLAFAESMGAASEALVRRSGLPVQLVFAFSDEASVLFCEAPFDGRIEKLDSVVASFFASAVTLSLASDVPLAFDARVVPVSAMDIQPYLESRQNEAWRNHVHAYGYYYLRKNGQTGREAHATLLGMTSNELHELMFRHGINLAKTPPWQRRGVLVYREMYEKKGFDRKSHSAVITRRSRVVQNWDLPLFKSSEGREVLSGLLGPATDKYE